MIEFKSKTDKMSFFLVLSTLLDRHLICNIYLLMFSLFIS